METIPENTKVELVDTHTKAVIAVYTYAQRKRARNRADRMDNAYGGYRYAVCVRFGEVV